MNVFVTGASGWVGSHVITELVSGGHTVTGLARSDASAAALEAMGLAVHRGSLEDTESLRRGAAAADAVIHAAFDNDLSNFAKNGVVETSAIEAIGSALSGSGKAFVVTSGVAIIAPGREITEDDVRDTSIAFPRDPETAVASFAAQGVRVSVIRLSPSVHGAGENHGFLPMTIRAARDHGVSAYVADGKNRWSGVHVRDAARLYRLALEHAAPRAVYHAVADEGVPVEQIATIIGRRLNLPAKSISAADADEHFGPFARFAELDVMASSAKTKHTLGWKPIEPSLLEDLDGTAYFA